MDTDTLVNEMIDSGAALIEKLRQQRVDVTAAFWVKTSEEGSWFLYIASTIVDNEGLAAGYRKLYGALPSVANSWIFRSNLKLIGMTTPIAEDVLNIQQRGSAPLATRYGGRQLGSLSIEEAYIYPPSSGA